MRRGEAARRGGEAEPSPFSQLILNLSSTLLLYLSLRRASRSLAKAGCTCAEHMLLCVGHVLVMIWTRLGDVSGMRCA